MSEFSLVDILATIHCRNSSTEKIIVPETQQTNHTAQKMKFFIKNFFSKCDQIRRKPRVWSHLLKKSLMENFIFVQSIFLMATPSH